MAKVKGLVPLITEDQDNPADQQLHSYECDCDTGGSTGTEGECMCDLEA